MELNWTELGKRLRVSADDAHADSVADGEAVSVDLAYAFLLDNPECFSDYYEWPADMPKEPNIELVSAYYDHRECLDCHKRGGHSDTCFLWEPPEPGSDADQISAGSHLDDFGRESSR